MAHIAGLVLRASDKHMTARFYESLGLIPYEHAHGGPKHYELRGSLPKTIVESHSAVFEVYQRSDAYSFDAIMVEVDSIDDSLKKVLLCGVSPKGEIRDVGEMKFVYITDPDGRDVMLIEKK
jgi:hypothetical protein